MDFQTESNAVFKHAPGQVSADLGGEMAILDSKSGIYYGLDQVGARVWSLIQENKNLMEIRDCLLEEYEVGSEQLEQDICALIVQLQAKGLIEKDTVANP